MSRRGGRIYFGYGILTAILAGASLTEYLDVYVGVMIVMSVFCFTLSALHDEW